MPPKHLALAVLFFAFIACCGNDTITYGGQTYKTVQIGEQVWFAENLNYEAESSVCYENNPANCAKYGRLYNWETAMKVCPRGWHLPTDKEWDKLFRFVDGDTSTESPYKSETAGKHLKAVSGWSSGKEFDGNGTDKFGFSALPGGHCLPSNGFYDAVTNGFWWSARMEGIYHAYLRGMYYNNENAYWADSPKSFLFSVRCVKD